MGFLCFLPIKEVFNLHVRLLVAYKVAYLAYCSKVQKDSVESVSVLLPKANLIGTMIFTYHGPWAVCSRILCLDNLCAILYLCGIPEGDKYSLNKLIVGVNNPSFWPLIDEHGSGVE